MATSSFFHDVYLQNKNEIQRFVEAAEKSAQRSSSDTPDCSVMNMTNEELRLFLKQVKILNQ